MTIAQEHHYSAGFSPNSDEHDNDHGLYDDDGKDLFDFDDAKPKKSNGRKGSGPGAADKRATHNAIERARRESLNGRFMTLAEALPSMANVKRPSKSIIVNKALDFVFDAQVKEHALIKENNDLRLQVDQLRSRLGMAPLPPPAPLLGDGPKRKPSSSTSPRTGSPTFSSPSPTAAAQQSSLPLSIPIGLQPQMYASPASGAGASPTGTTVASSSEMDHMSPSSSTDLHSFHHAAALAAVQQQQQQQSPASFGQQFGVAQAQAALLAQAQFGYMNPSLLSQQHQQLLLAAHIQAQQQGFAAQQQQQQQPQGIEALWATTGQAQSNNNNQWAGASYNPLEPYPFMA